MFMRKDELQEERKEAARLGRIKGTFLGIFTTLLMTHQLVEETSAEEYQSFDDDVMLAEVAYVHERLRAMQFAFETRDTCLIEDQQDRRLEGERRLASGADKAGR